MTGHAAIALRSSTCSPPPPLEPDLRASLDTVRRIQATGLGPGGCIVECTACGSRARVTRPARRCALCGGRRLRRGRGAGRVVAPSRVLPFAVDRDEAWAAVRRWAASRWLAPRAALRVLGPPEGVYLPHWRIEARTVTHYRGRRGETHWEREPAPTPLRPHRTRRVRRTRWRSTTGTVRMRFGHLLVCASRSLPPGLLRRLPPWDLTDMMPHRPEWIGPAWTERYGVEFEEGLRVAQARMDRDIRQAIRDEIGGDTQRIHDMQVDHRDARCAHVLLPVWVRAYRHQGQLYRVLVDARTGVVVGESPLSPLRVFVLTLALTLAVLFAGRWALG